MAIDRTQLLLDEKLWLPDDTVNLLNDTQMQAINEYVIANEIPADDEQYHAEAVCKGLRAIALANNAKYTVSIAGKKREKVDGEEVEWYLATSVSPWIRFIDSLKDLCPIFGYTGLTSSGVGIIINPGDKFVLTDCPTEEDLHL